MPKNHRKSSVAPSSAGAEAGDPQAQYDLAVLLSESSSESEKEQGLNWFTEACRNGHPDAMLTMASLFLTQPQPGYSLEEVNTTALALLERVEASPATPPELLHLVGQMHLQDLNDVNGETIRPADPSRGVEILKAAADRGSAESLCLLAALLIAQDHSQASIEQAVALYTKAAEMGHAEAQERLGKFYSGGEFCDPDHAKAFFWYSKAAEGGNATAQFCLYQYYTHGLTGAGVDYQKAFHWCNLAGKQGYADAQWCLGILHERGDATAPNRSLALEWYEKAAAQGHEEAAKEISRLRFEIGAIPERYVPMVQKLRVAENENELRAMLNQAACLMHGWNGIEIDYEQALAIYMATAQQALVLALFCGWLFPRESA